MAESSEKVELCVWWEFVLGDFVSLPPFSTDVTVSITILRMCVLRGSSTPSREPTIWHRRISLYDHQGQYFLSYHYDSRGKVEKIGFREVAPNLQTSVDLLNFSRCSTLVPLFLHKCALFWRALQLPCYQIQWLFSSSFWLTSWFCWTHNLIFSGFPPLLTCVILHYS